jgi:hypothetical protein
MIGKRYRKPSETYGFVHQSTAATMRMIAPLTVSTGFRLCSRHSRSRGR